MRRWVLCVILMAGGMFGCRKVADTKRVDSDQVERQLDRRESVFMVSVAPILEKEFGLVGSPVLYLVNCFRVGSNTPGLVSEGYLTDRASYDQDALPSVAAPIMLSALYRNHDTEPCAIKCDLDLDMEYLREYRSRKDLSAASQNLLDSILDPKNRSIKICGDDKAALGPVAGGKRKVSISAPWPLPKQGEVLEHNSFPVYAVESRALRAIAHHMKDKMILGDCDVAFLCDYPAYCSGTSKVNGLDFAHCGLILRSGKIAGKISLHGMVWCTDDRSLIDLSISWKDDFRKVLNPAVREQVEKLDPDTMQGDNSSFKLQYLRKANRMDFSLPFDYKKGKIEALPNDNIQLSGKTQIIER